MKTAQVLIVGNEILSGRTQDTNTQFLAKALSLRAVRLTGVRIVSDDIVQIVKAIRTMRKLADFLFVCGGIGGTPDDKTREATAQAFDVPLVRNPQAESILKTYYGDRANEARLRMADLPQGCELINNPITRAPGIKIKNTYVFAGIPKLVEAMFASVQRDFAGGNPLFEREAFFDFGEGDLTPFMEIIDKKYPTVELGSYPQIDISQFSLPFERRRFRTQIVIRGQDAGDVEKAFEEFLALVENGVSAKPSGKSI